MTQFKARILKEEAPPSFAMQADHCELAKHSRRFIWGEGNPVAPLFILLDNPGLRENKDGEPFICGTRETLQLGLMQAGIDLDNVYVSYILKRRPTRAYDKPRARANGMQYVKYQLAEKKPTLILGLGNVVAQTLFTTEDNEVVVKNLRGTWHTFEGITTSFSYHPLAVRRRPNLLPYFLADLKMVAKRIAEHRH